MVNKTNKKVHLKHFERFAPFTVWCWCIQGVYFTIAACSSAGILPAQNFLSGVAWISFELSFSVAYLVSAVVSFVLIPATVKRGLPLDNFFRPWPLIMHNANVVFIAVEMVLNRLPFTPHHHPFVLLYACSYVLFAWFWFQRKGYFFYFFLDYASTYAVLWYLALLALLLLCFFGGVFVSSLVDQGSYTAIAALVVVTVMVQRVR